LTVINLNFVAHSPQSGIVTALGLRSPWRFGTKGMMKISPAVVRLDNRQLSKCFFAEARKQQIQKRRSDLHSAYRLLEVKSWIMHYQKAS
jgi:hypothetical protein